MCQSYYAIDPSVRVLTPSKVFDGTPLSLNWVEQNSSLRARLATLCSPTFCIWVAQRVTLRVLLHTIWACGSAATTGNEVDHLGVLNTALHTGRDALLRAFGPAC